MSHFDMQQEREKSKNLSILTQLWPFLSHYRGLMWSSTTALVLTAMISLMLPMAVRRVVDNFNGDDMALLNQYLLAALGFVALLALGTALRFSLVSRLGERVVADIRKAVFDRVIGMSPAFYERILTGEVLSRITTDTTLVLSVIGSSVSIALRNILMLIGGLALMLWTSLKLTLLVLLIVPVVIVPIIVLGRKLRRLSKMTQDCIALSSGKASEALSAVQTVQAFTHETHSRADFAHVTEESYAVAKRRIATRALMASIMIFLVFSGILGVLWIGALDLRAGEISAGVLVQFVIYSILVAGAVGALAEIWGELQRAAGATERLYELLKICDDIRDPARPLTLPARLSGAVEFDDVSFSYPARPDISAIRDMRISITAGETVALVGPSGSGKTTVIQLLLRHYDPAQGKICLDGHDLRDLKRDDFRRHIALVSQDPIIFAASARDNIRFGRPDASDFDIERAARAAAADAFIQDLPDGYDTYVGERGVMLSGGQKQRIAIARAILRDAPILLLDEATSALDSESESAVQRAVDTLAKDRTTLIIAHRLATVKKADRILVMEAGRIVAQGTHDELVAENGLYARLARLQFTEGVAA